MKTIFKDELKDLVKIPDFCGYFASKKGKIYTTLKQGCRNRYDLSKRISPVELNIRYTNKDYARVYMRRESTNKREDVYVHRIIAELFIPNPDNLPEVNHKDSNRKNNYYQNLEWVSRIDNINYAFTNGFMTRDKLGRFTHK